MRTQSIVNDLATTIANLPLTVKRMVMEQKNNPGDYGSFEKTQASSSNSLLDNAGGSANEISTVGDNNVPSEVDSFVQEIYQNEPLINQDWQETHQRIYSSSASTHSSPRSASVKIDIPAPSREEPRYPKEKLKTFFAFIFLAVNMFLTTVVLSIVHEKVPSRDKYGPLPDVILDNFGQDNGWCLYSSEVLIMLSSTAAFFVVLFHKHRFIVMRRVFLIVGLLYMMRCITMYVTVLPMANSTYFCSPKANTTGFVVIMKRSLQLLSGFGLSINGKHTYCGDYVYSGHTVILVMCYLIIQEYTPRRCLLFHWLAALSAIAGMILILVAKAHYTIDVLIAYYVTTRLFWIYHQMANHKDLKKSNPNNFLSRVWWFFMFRYFEKNVSGMVPRQFDWPLTLPRRFYAKHARDS